MEFYVVKKMKQYVHTLLYKYIKTLIYSSTNVEIKLN